MVSSKPGQLVWCTTLVFAGVCAGACATTTANSPVVPAAEPAEAGPTRLALKPIPLRAMTDSEQGLERTLRQNVAALLVAGERHSGNEWGLASATDLLAQQLESNGINVTREGFMSPGGELAQNLVVNFPGTELPQEVVLLGAQYDSAPGSPGADDNATGALALLEVAKAQYGKARRRTLRLVWFSDASRRARAELAGAWHHFELAAKPKRDDEPTPIGTDLRLCVDLHGLGVFSEALDSQKYAPGMPAGHPIAEFVEVLSLPQYMAQGTLVSATLGNVSSVPVKNVTTLETDANEAVTPFAAFAAHGCPAVLVHDTGALRFPEFGKAGDTAERLDFNRFARVVDALIRATESWVDAATIGAASAPSVPSEVNAERQEPSE